MSIVALKKATIYAPSAREKPMMEQLQELGFLHLVPLESNDEIAVEPKGVPPESKKALKFLLQAPHRRRQLHGDRSFHAHHVKSKALHLQQRLKDLREERDRLRVRIRQLRPWGNFTLPPRTAMEGISLWFYAIPHKRTGELTGSGYVWQAAGRDNRFDYVVVMSPGEPDLPFERTHAGTEPLVEYQHALEVIENEIEDAQAQRIGLTRWLDLYTNSLHRLEDQEVLEQASLNAYKDDALVVVQAWLPAEDAACLRELCAREGYALILEDPTEGDKPPTLLENAPKLSIGEDLLQFYMTPGYRQNDPSVLLFFSFVLFFGMIFADAGYGILSALATLAGWRAMGKSLLGKRMRILVAALSGSTIVWGVLVGSYFGLQPPEHSVLATLHTLDVYDYATMMALSVVIGALHLMLANGVVAYHRYRSGKRAAMLAPAGWIAVIFGGLSAYLWPSLLTFGMASAGLGLVLVFFFSEPEAKGFRRFAGGLLGLTKISSAFGDILSYLRLFALGLATSSMAVAFNELAARVADQFAGMGVLLAIIVLLIGHSLNVALGIVSGVVHGLRLNLIEYLNWGMPEEGRPFKAFQKKEKAAWNPSS